MFLYEEKQKMAAYSVFVGDIYIYGDCCGVSFLSKWGRCEDIRKTAC